MVLAALLDTDSMTSAGCADLDECSSYSLCSDAAFTPRAWAQLTTHAAMTAGPATHSNMIAYKETEQHMSQHAML